MKKLFSKLSVANVMAAFALMVSVSTVNSACMFLFHQPEVPAELKKYRKF